MPVSKPEGLECDFCKYVVDEAVKLADENQTEVCRPVCLSVCLFVCHVTPSKITRDFLQFLLNHWIFGIVQRLLSSRSQHFMLTHTYKIEGVAY